MIRRQNTARPRTSLEDLASDVSGTDFNECLLPVKDLHDDGASITDESRCLKKKHLWSAILSGSIGVLSLVCMFFFL